MTTNRSKCVEHAVLTMEFKIMGIRQASEVDLPSMATSEFDYSPAERFDAIVRYLISKKYGTVSQLCEQTSLSRSTVQARIFQHKELGSRALRALAEASGVDVIELTRLPARELLTKIDSHLGMNTEGSHQGIFDDSDHANAELILNSFFGKLLSYKIHADHQTAEDFEDMASWKKATTARLLTGDLNLFVAERHSDDEYTDHVTWAPCPPKDLRISKAFCISYKDEPSKLGERSYIAFFVVLMGDEEIDQFADVSLYTIRLSNTLVSAYGPSGSLIALAVDQSTKGNGLSVLNQLKPRVISKTIEISVDKSLSSNSDYFLKTLFESLQQ